MKEIVKKVIAGDPMTPVETPYPPSMIKTAIYMTAAQFNRPGAGARHRQARRAADHPGKCGGILLPRFTVLTIVRAGRLPAPPYPIT